MTDDDGVKIVFEAEGQEDTEIVLDRVTWLRICAVAGVEEEGLLSVDGRLLGTTEEHERIHDALKEILRFYAEQHGGDVR